MAEVSDAMIEAGCEKITSLLRLVPQSLPIEAEIAAREIYLAMKAASHPLEQQQACKHCGMIEEGHEPSECCGDGGGSTFEAVSGAWQLIETAPDGDILLWDGREIDVGYAAWEQGGKPVYFNGDVRVDATHWMPLPEPPRTALQEEGVERRD